MCKIESIQWSFAFHIHRYTDQYMGEGDYETLLFVRVLFVFLVLTQLKVLSSFHKQCQSNKDLLIAFNWDSLPILGLLSGVQLTFSNKFSIRYSFFFCSIDIFLSFWVLSLWFSCLIFYLIFFASWFPFSTFIC